MAFAQLTQRESLRDTETCLRSLPGRLYHLGIRGNIARSTLADANEHRDWRTYADFAQVLIAMARRLYEHDPLAAELEETVYAFDSTTIDLCLSLFPWAPFQKNKAAIKLHTLLDLRGSIPTVIHISDGRVGDVTMLRALEPEAGSFYIFDRGYMDFAQLNRFQEAAAFFVIRAWKNLVYRRRYSHPVDRATGLRCDQTITLAGEGSAKKYPGMLRRIRYTDPERSLRFVFLTNNFRIPPLTVARLYKSRWEIELFFRWIKQHLRIRSFFGTSANAVKTQIWIAMSVYLLAAIVRQRLGLQVSLYSFLQVVGVTIFEKTPILQLFEQGRSAAILDGPANQLSLLEF
jgi:transposase